MAFGDILRSANFTGDDIADLIEGIGVSGHPLTTATWSPSYSASGSMTYTSVTTSLAAYVRIGKIVLFSLFATGTTGGSASTSLIATLPVTADATFTSANAPFACTVADGASAIGGVAYIGSSTQVYATRYDAANFGTGASRVMRVSGWYKST